jgi:hypothetical protein
MTWFDSTTPYNTTSRSAVDRLSYKQDAGGSNPPSSTLRDVAEVQVVETPGRGPGGSRFESGRSPHAHPRRSLAARRDTRLATHAHRGGSGDQRGLISFAQRVRFPPPQPIPQSPINSKLGPVAQFGSAAPLQGEGCGFESRAVHNVFVADVAQLEEARRSDRRQCGSTPAVSTNASRTWTKRNSEARRRRKPEVGSSNLSVQTYARWWNRYHAWLLTRRTGFESWSPPRCLCRCRVP